MKKRVFSLIAIIAVITAMLLPVIPEGVVCAAQEVFSGIEGFSEDEGFAIVPQHAGASALDVSASDKTKVQLYEAHRGENQTWKIQKHDDYYSLVNFMNNKVLEVPGGKTDNGTALKVAAFDGSDKQLWKLDPCGDGSYFIRSKLNNNKAVDVHGFGTGNGTAIELYAMTARDPTGMFGTAPGITAGITPIRRRACTRSVRPGSSRVFRSSCVTA